MHRQTSRQRDVECSLHSTTLRMLCGLMLREHSSSCYSTSLCTLLCAPVMLHICSSSTANATIRATLLTLASCNSLAKQRCLQIRNLVNNSCYQHITTYGGVQLEPAACSSNSRLPVAAHSNVFRMRLLSQSLHTHTRNCAYRVLHHHNSKLNYPTICKY
jgi:hypothetical protein